MYDKMSELEIIQLPRMQKPAFFLKLLHQQVLDNKSKITTGKDIREDKDSHPHMDKDLVD